MHEEMLGTIKLQPKFIGISIAFGNRMQNFIPMQISEPISIAIPIPVKGKNSRNSCWRDIGSPARSTFNAFEAACICGLILCLIGLPSPLLQVSQAQTLSNRLPLDARSPSVFRVSSNLVTVPVSVTDSAGHAIRELEICDFGVEEDGNSQTISKLSEPGRSPLQLVLLFDLSGSVNSGFEFEHQVAIRLLEKVWEPGDTISIIVFTEAPHME
jgi:hypothetical protein